MVPGVSGFSRRNVKGRNVRNLAQAASGKNFGGDTLNFDGLQENGKFSAGMMYELVIRAREQFDLGLADGFGFNPESGEFMVSRGGESVQNREYFDMLEAYWGMLAEKDSQIRKLQSGGPQVDSDDEGLYMHPAWQEVLNLRKIIDEKNATIAEKDMMLAERDASGDREESIKVLYEGKNRELQEMKKELASTTKELNRTQERLAEKSRQKMVAEREAQAANDRADSKEAARLQQLKQLDELEASRREDARKLQVAEAKKKEAEEKRQREEELRRKAESTLEEVCEERDGYLETIRGSEASVQGLRTKLTSAERRNAEMAKQNRRQGSRIELLRTCLVQVESELEVELAESVRGELGAVTYLDAPPCDLDPKELERYVAMMRQFSHLGMKDLRQVPGFPGALRRARLRSLRGRVANRVLGSDSCKSPKSTDWTCTVCGTVTFGSKKTDQCFHCKTVRKRSGK